MFGPNSESGTDSPAYFDRRRLASVAALVLLALVAGVLHVRSYHQELQLRADMNKFTDAAHQMDEVLRPYADKANIWLAYEGYTTVDMDERFRMLQWYTRATYTFYPWRVYVADRDTAVPVGFSGNPMPDFQPSPAWLAAHHIKDKLILRREPDDDITLYQKKL